jgi:hypothetical protein
MGKSHFSGLISTWNLEVFPRSLEKVSEVIPDSQAASCSGGSMGGKQVVDMSNVANILKQLSFEENLKEKEDEEEDHDNRSDGHRDPEGHESEYGFNSDNEDNEDVYRYESQPRVLPVTVDPEPLIPMDSAPSSSFIAEPTVTTTATISSQTLETQLTGDEVQLHDQSSKAPPTVKKPSRAPVQKGPVNAGGPIQSRSSSHLVKAPSLQVDDSDPLSLPSLAPIQPRATDTTDDVTPKPKRATRGRAAATKSKGKTRK